MPSQNIINRQWVFGLHAGLDFSTPVPTPTSSNLINTGEGCASISNASGQLLLATDGSTLWNGANATIASGVPSGLAGNGSSTQSSIIVPDPANSQRYYVFTADGATGNNRHFNGLRVDVSTWTSVPLSSLLTVPANFTTGLSPTEKVTAIQHANCVDYWVVTIVQGPQVALDASNGPGIFRVFLVNSTGVQHVGDTPMNINVHDVGYLKADPTGSRLAVANYFNNNVLLYNFNNALGVVNISSLVTIPVPLGLPTGHARAPYGVEFSPNSNVLYYSLLGVGGGGAGANNNGYIFQVDLTAPPVSNQIVQYANPDNIGYALGALQLGIDGRIYVAKHGERSVGAILNPNVLGSGCGPNMNFIMLAPNTNCNLGLPNLLPNQCDCACDSGCDEDVSQANQILNDRADHKQFTIVANGQTLPAVCNLAFTNANFAPVFTLQWGDGPSDHFESDDLEVIYIRINNPFRNLVYRDIIIFNIKITPNQTLPDGVDAI